MSPESNLLNALKMELPCKVVYLKDGYDPIDWVGRIKANNVRNSKLVVPEDNIDVAFDNIQMVTLLER